MACPTVPNPGCGTKGQRRRKFPPPHRPATEPADPRRVGKPFGGSWLNLAPALIFRAFCAAERSLARTQGKKKPALGTCRVVESDKASEYRRKADELRTIAETVKDRDSREALLRLASDYERLAQQAEQREGDEQRDARPGRAGDDPIKNR